MASQRHSKTVCKCVVLLLIIGPCLVNGQVEQLTYVQQFQRVISKTLGSALGLAGLLLKSTSSPTTVY